MEYLPDKASDGTREKIYRLVQVKDNKFSPSRVPLAMSGQKVIVWYHTNPQDQWKRVRVTSPKKSSDETGSYTTTRSSEENNVSFYFFPNKVQISTLCLRDGPGIFEHVI